MFAKAGKWALMAALGWSVVGVPVGLTAAVAAPKAAETERHPHIHRAIRELRAARKALKEADHDFKGHREDAIKACDNAIVQLELCLKVDKK